MKKLFRGAGMNIREFLSKCLKFNEDRKMAYDAKVLDLKWDIYKDTIEMEMKLTVPSPPKTKPSIVAIFSWAI